MSASQITTRRLPPRGNGEGAGSPRGFRAPGEAFEALSPELAGQLIAAAADLALVVDGEGVVRDLAIGSGEFPEDHCRGWLSRPWVDVVTVESRPRVEALLNDARDGRPARWRHIHHPMQRGGDLPLMYSVIPLGGNNGQMLAVGRDLRAMSVLQQRLLDLQQALERDYARRRHVETRYRLLFQTAAEALLILDAATLRIVEANPASAELLDASAKTLLGRVFPTGFDPDGAQAVQRLLSGVQVAGRAEDTRAASADGQRSYRVAASLFRQDGASLLLVRISNIDPTGGQLLQKAHAHMLDVIDGVPDGFVVTNLDGQVMAANAAFLDLCQVATEEQVRGQALEHWLGQSRGDFNVLMGNLRKHGSVRLFPSALRGEYGSIIDVEVNAAAVNSGAQPCLGFTLRTFSPRTSIATRAASRELPHSVGQLTDLVGRVPLKELVRESTDLVECLCIEAALELTGDNRSSAAEMLGLSRQSLYVKLRRYGLGGGEGEGAAAAVNES